MASLAVAELIPAPAPSVQPFLLTPAKHLSDASTSPKLELKRNKKALEQGKIPTLAPFY